jgi:hypothetical protein
MIKKIQDLDQQLFKLAEDLVDAGEKQEQQDQLDMKLKEVEKKRLVALKQLLRIEKIQEEIESTVVQLCSRLELGEVPLDVSEHFSSSHIAAAQDGSVVLTPSPAAATRMVDMAPESDSVAKDPITTTDALAFQIPQISETEKDFSIYETKEDTAMDIQRIGQLKTKTKFGPLETKTTDAGIAALMTKMMMTESVPVPDSNALT